MLNALYSDLDWQNVKTVGFDMDGTLYDEYNFIEQVYSEINKQLIKNDNVLSFMLNRWIEKGSSYSHIFSEAYDKCNTIYSREIFIQKALEIFRNYSPSLVLPERNRKLLSYFKDNFDLFLITDGNYELQKKKFITLGLEKYFYDQNVIFTGEYGSAFHKPSINSLQFLNLNLKKSIYFGDRDKDEEFAKLANMQFKKVYNMIEVKK